MTTTLFVDTGHEISANDSQPRWFFPTPTGYFIQSSPEERGAEGSPAYGMKHTRTITCRIGDAYAYPLDSLPADLNLTMHDRTSDYYLHYLGRLIEAATDVGLESWRRVGDEGSQSAMAAASLNALEAVPLVTVTRAEASQPGRVSRVAPAMNAIALALPSWSETELASLFGVTRQAWRAWRRGEYEPRSAKRRKLYSLQRILDLRRAIANEPPQAWFERPQRDGMSPADLWTQGRTDVVNLQAAVRSVGAQRVAKRLKIGDLVDRGAAQHRLDEYRDSRVPSE